MSLHIQTIRPVNQSDLIEPQQASRREIFPVSTWKVTPQNNASPAWLSALSILLGFLVCHFQAARPAEEHQAEPPVVLTWKRTLSPVDNTTRTTPRFGPQQAPLGGMELSPGRLVSSLHQSRRDRRRRHRLPRQGASVVGTLGWINYV